MLPTDPASRSPSTPGVSPGPEGPRSPAAKSLCPLGGSRGRVPGCKASHSPHAPPAGSASWAAGNRCVDAAEACTADSRCQQLRAQYVAQCLGRAAEGGCPRSRCRRALRLFFARGPPAHTLALLFCPCASPTCAERRRQTFVPTCAFSRPGAAPPSCLEPRDACERSRVCRCVPRAGQARGACGARRGQGRSRPPSAAQASPPRLPGLLRPRPRSPRWLSAWPRGPLPACLCRPSG